MIDGPFDLVEEGRDGPFDHVGWGVDGPFTCSCAVGVGAGGWGWRNDDLANFLDSSYTFLFCFSLFLVIALDRHFFLARTIFFEVIAHPTCKR